MVTQHTAMVPAIISRQFLRMAASDMPRWVRMEKIAEPTMMHTWRWVREREGLTMKQEKTIPRGVEPVSRTGVHRNTKMYMQDSRICITAI